MKGLYPVSLAAVSVALGAAPAVFAQQQGAQPEQQGQLADIVVTAQFRAQNVQEAPLAITAVNSEMLEARSQTNVSEVASRAPSVQLTTGGQGGGAQTATVSIRGIGQADFNFAVEPGVGTYIDDVYYGIPFGTAFDLVDIDRVEILRGPQGTLSGKNSIGGSLKLFSKKPGAESDGYIEGIYGSFNRVNLRAATNLTIVPDKLYARLTGMARHVDGYLKRYDYSCVTGRPAPGGSFAPGTGDCKIGTEGGQEVYALRGALRWLVSDGIENNLIVDFTEDRSEASPVKIIEQPDYGNGNNYVTGPKDYTSYANYTGLADTSEQFTVPAISHLRNWGISNNLTANLSPNLTLTSITAYRYTSGRNAWDGDGSPQALFNNFNVLKHKQFSQELRLSANVGDFADFTVGAFYYDARDRQGGRIDVETVGLDFAYDDPIKNRSKSGFAHLVLHPTDRFNITGGLRYTDEKKIYTFTRYSPIIGVPTNPFVAPLDGVVRSFKGNRWDYRLAIDYEIADDIRPYVQVATGFKGGGINPRPFFVQQAVTFDQEKVTSYEAGIKTMLFDRRVRLNAAYFHTDYNNLQAQLLACDSISPFPGAPCAATQNVGNAKIDGFEVEGEMGLGNFSLDGSVSFTDFRYTDVNPSSGITTATRPQFAPRWKYSVGAQYKIDLGGAGSITPRLDWVWQSKMESGAINNVPFFMNGTVESFGLLNGRLTYRSADEDWQLSLAVTNITDKFYYVNKYDREAQFGAIYGQPGRPREWQVSIKRTF